MALFLPSNRRTVLFPRLNRQAGLFLSLNHRPTLVARLPPQSRRFLPSQWTPRFPRIFRLRSDKDVEGVIPYQEIVDIANGANGRAREREK